MTLNQYSKTPSLSLFFGKMGRKRNKIIDNKLLLSYSGLNKKEKGMSLAKKRVNLTMDHKTYSALKGLSGKRKQKISTLSLHLIQEALDLQEDIYFSKIADKRLSQKQKLISHDKVWK